MRDQACKYVVSHPAEERLTYQTVESLATALLERGSTGPVRVFVFGVGERDLTPAEMRRLGYAIGEARHKAKALDAENGDMATALGLA